MVHRGEFVVICMMDVVFSHHVFGRRKMRQLSRRFFEYFVA